MNLYLTFASSANVFVMCVVPDKYQKCHHPTLFNVFINYKIFLGFIILWIMRGLSFIILELACPLCAHIFL